MDRRSSLRFLYATLFISFEEGDPELVLCRNIISVQEAAHEKSINEMFSLRGLESSLISACVQQQQEISTISDKTSDLLSDIRTFLETHSSSIATIEAPPISGNTLSSQSGQRKHQRSNEQQPISISIAYVDIDEKHKSFIERDLRTLSRQGWNIKWNAYNINAPSEWVTDVDDPLNACHLLLLLVSPEFVSSEFCYDSSISQAVRRHMSSFWVSPILLRPCLWEDTPFGQNQVGGRGLPVLPKNLLPVVEWPREDGAFLEIAQGVKRALEYLKGRI